MSGVEVAALVATVVSAFAASIDLVRKYKKKKLQKKTATPTEAVTVEESLARGPPRIQSEYDRDFSLLGPRFAQGDDIARSQLKDVIIDLQCKVIDVLNAHLVSGGGLASRAWAALHGTSEKSRRRTIAILVDQSQRLTGGAPLFQDVPGVSYQSQGPQLSGTARQNAPGGERNRHGPPIPSSQRPQRFREPRGGPRDDEISGNRARRRSRSSDLYSNSDDDISPSRLPRPKSLTRNEASERKAVSKKQLVTVGLASITTTYMAYSVYQSIEGRKHLYEEVRYGDMTPEEARGVRDKARVHDAISIGIAALGITCAYGEWKEVKKQRAKIKAPD